MGTSNVQTYHQSTSNQNTVKLRELLKTMPSFCRDYFRGIEPTTTAKTRIGYGYDIRTFFRFLLSENPSFKNAKMTDICLSDLDQLQPVDIEEYLEYLKYYTYDGQVFTNDERGIKRKFASLRSFFLYYQKRDLLRHNPTVVVDMPKLHDREIIRLDADEVSDLLELVEHGGDHLSGMKRSIMRKISREIFRFLHCFLERGFVFRSVSDLILRMLILRITVSGSFGKAARRNMFILARRLPMR